VLLQDYNLTMTTCKEGPCKDSSCAIVELSDNIISILPHLSKIIKGCTYDPVVNIMSFCRKGMNVALYARLIVILNVKDEAAARRAIDWLKDIILNADEKNGESGG